MRDEVDSGLTHYGQRLRGFVVPPTDGDYVFWIASDDSSALTRQRGRSVADVLRRIRFLRTNPREWTREPGQQSAPITLQAGGRYYVEARCSKGLPGITWR